MKHVTLRVTTGLLAFVWVGVWGVPTLAHHILGIPHYAYDERYPQAPVIKYAVEAGPYIVELTGYPGNPIPGERAEMHAYLKPKSTGAPYTEPLRVRIVEGTHTSEDLSGVNIFGPEMLEAEGNLFIFHATYPDDGIYTVKLHFEAEGQPVTISFPLTVGQPKSAWAPLVWTAGFMAVVVVVIRAIAIKRRRISKRSEGVSVNRPGLQSGSV